MDKERFERLLERNSFFRLSRKIDYPLVPADALQINFTFRCNLRCTMCSMHEREESFKAQNRPVDLDISTIKKLIKEGAEMKVPALILIGGEPFLEPRLFEMVSFAADCGFSSITVVTNGTIMSEKIVEKMFEANLSNLSVSIDAATEESFSKIRGQNYLEKIIANVKLINAMKEKRGRYSPSICCVCTIMDQNAGELMDVIELCRSLKISSVIFQPVVGDNTDQEKAEMNSGVCIPPARLKLLEDSIDAIIQFKKMNECNFDLVANAIENLESIKKYFQGRTKITGRPCYAGYNRIQVVQEGKLYFCVNQNSHEATFGDVKKDSLKDLWYSANARDLRKLIRQCSKPCLQWCSYRDDFDLESNYSQKRKLFSSSIVDAGLENARPGIMKIALVQCPCPFGVERPSLGLAYLNANGCEASVLDLNIMVYHEVAGDHKTYWDSHNRDRWCSEDSFYQLPFITEQVYEQCVDRILAVTPDVICFSVQKTSALFTLEIIKRVKSRYPEVKILLGGTCCYNLTQDDRDLLLPHGLQKFADFIITGEGEQILLNVLFRLQSGGSLEGCNGVAINRDGKWVFSGMALPLKRVGLYIPCYNAEKTLSACLEAVFRQTYPVVEVAVVDDGSTDRTCDIASSYGVRLFRHETNKGLAAARNTALKNMNTEFVASLDADCVADHDWLSRLMSRFDDPNICGMGGKLLESKTSSVFDEWRAVHMKQYWEPENKVPEFLFGANTVLRRQVVLDVGFYDETLKNNYEDVNLSRRLMGTGQVLGYEAGAIAHHLKRDDIFSLFKTFWNWRREYYDEQKFFLDPENFSLKMKDNVGLANRYLDEDLENHREALLYLDFFLAIHHSLMDLEHFMFRDTDVSGAKKEPRLSPWLALIDLTFFYRYAGKRNALSSLLSPKESFSLNLFALILALNRWIIDRFGETEFQRLLYKHLLISVYNTHDDVLLEKLMGLVRERPDWIGLLEREHPHLNPFFLKLTQTIKAWLDDGKFRSLDLMRSSDLIDRIKSSQAIVERNINKKDNVDEN
ncbi:MAG: glycosyltransferase [Candidatus Omnitrophota bacterium]